MKNHKRYEKPVCVFKIRYADILTDSKQNDPFDPMADDIYFKEGEQNQ